MTSRATKDSIVLKLEEGIEKAKAAGVSPEVMSAIVTARDMMVIKNAYTIDATTDDNNILKAIEKETYTHNWQKAFDEGKTQWNLKPGMLCGRMEGQFLKSFVSVAKAKRILEVGMFTGYSALSMAEALPADGEIVSLEICSYLKPLVEGLVKDSPHRNKIRCVIGHATDEMKKMSAAGDKFDVVFLDGDKKDYTEQFKILFDDNLLSPGGTVLVDNAYGHGAAFTPPIQPSHASALLDEVKTRADLHRVMLPINDGVLMIRRLADVEGSV